jgi:hypothetical protein
MKSFVVLCSLLLAQNAFAQSFASDTQDAQDFVAATETAASYNYCIAGTLTCRTLVLRKDKVTGVQVAGFWDVFLSSERAVGSTGYFLENGDGTLRAILDEQFDGQVGITKKYAQNQALTITVDGAGFPTIHDVTLVRLGTTRSILADMSYSATEASIIGTETDSADPTYSQPVNVIYLRQ